MVRVIVTFGLIGGLVAIFGIIGTILLSWGSVWLGYLVMLVALSAILVGVKQHRDQALGGVIKFRTGLGIGLGIAVVAALVYAAVWEGYQALTHYQYMDHYIAQTLAAKRAAGVSGAAYAKAAAELAELGRNYANPLYRLATTFVEIFPVGVLVALVSAVLLRNPRFLPARGR